MKKALRLTIIDNVATLLTQASAGEIVRVLDEWGAETDSLMVREVIPAGHKIALCDIPAAGEAVKYGFPIGTATQAIRCGERVHTHNLESGRGRGDR
jgi:altronate dehydratase